MESIYIEVLMSLMTLATGITAILSFLNARKKDTKSDSEKEGQLQADIQYMKNVLLDVRQEVKSTTTLLDNHSERLARVEEGLKQAHKRINETMEMLKRGA